MKRLIYLIGALMLSIIILVSSVTAQTKGAWVEYHYPRGLVRGEPLWATETSAEGRFQLAVSKGHQAKLRAGAPGYGETEAVFSTHGSVTLTLPDLSDGR